MNDKSKTKAQLNSELAQLREKVTELESTKNKYRNLFENLPIGIFQSTPAGQYRLVNPAFAAMAGFASPQEMINEVQDISTLYADPSDREEVKRLFAEQGQLNGHVIRHKHRNGQIRWMTLYAKSVYDDFGEIIYYDGFTMDITARLQAEEAQKLSKAALEKAQRVARVGSWEWQIQSNQLDWSDEMYHIFGIEKETFSGDLSDVISRAIHPEDRAKVEQANQTVINDRRPAPLEYRVIWPDGSIRVIRAEAGELLLDEAGNPATLTGIVQDITKQKKEQEVLRKSEEQFKAIFLQSPIAIELFDANGLLVEANQKCLEMFGVNDIQHVKGFNLFDDPNIPKNEIEKLKKGQQISFTSEFDFEIVKKQNLYPTSRSGKMFWDVFVKALLDENGYISGYLVHVKDITEQKQAEEQIYYQARLLENISDAVISTDNEFKIITWNQAAEQLYGWRANEVIGKNINKVLPQDFVDSDGKSVLAEYQKKGIWRGEVIQQTKKGEAIYTLASVSAIIDQTGNPVGAVAVNRDISDRMQVEEALLENQKRYKRAQAMGRVGNWEYDPVTTRFWGSDEAKRIYGFASDSKDFTTNNVENCIPERERVHQALIDLIEHDKEYDLEFDIITKDKGLQKTIHSIAEVERDAQGNPVKVTGVISDITERKQAADTIAESQERFNLAMNASRDGLFDWNLKTNEIYYSPGWKSMLGYEYDEIPNDFSIWETNTHPEDVKRSWQMQHEMINKKRDRFEIEFKMKHKNGHWVDILSRAEALFDENGKAVRIVGTHVDISDSKKSQRELQESEDKYRSLVETASDAIYLMDEDGTIIDTNQSACDTTGKTREEIVGYSIDSVDPNYPINKFLEFWQNVPFNKQMIFESTHLHKNGNQIPVELSGKKVKLDNKKYFYGIARDITERKQAERKQEKLTRQLEQQANQLQMVMDSVPEGVFVIDSNCRIILANPTARNDLAVLADGIGVGDSVQRLGEHPLDTLLTRPPEGLWHQISWQNRIFELIAKPLKGSEAAAGWVIVIRDVTIEKSIQEQIQQQERLVSVGQLAAGIAHDFNNIMAVITLYADLSLKDPRLPPDMTKRFDTIKKQSGRAGELIQQILDFSRRSVMERLPMDLIPFLKELKKLFDRTLPENIDVRLSYTENSFIVHGDPTRLQQVIMNLVVNARDAMPDGGMIQIDLARKNPGKFDAGVLNLTRKLKQDGTPREWVYLTIQDNGAGIPADVLPYIFDPFYTTKDSGKGTGLGLAQVSGIIEQHDGEISVLTEAGEGSTFIVSLPLLEETDSTKKIIEVEDIPFGHGETILVVEDNPEMRQAMVNSLESLNYRVQTAKNGREALAILREHSNEIALVLTDLIMPEMGGKALLQALQQAGTIIQVIVMTGHPLTDERETIMALGAVDWLNKPPSLEKLALTIARALA